MRGTALIVAIAGASLLLAATPAVAHHSFTAEFDSTKPIKLTGKVTKLEWTNPHAYLYVDVADPQTGKVTNWEIELGSPVSLSHLDWKRATVKVDDVVTVEGTRARYKENLANARSVILASTGQKLGAASSEAR
jgi:Family of unknown function (DUF6152)